MKLFATDAALALPQSRALLPVRTADAGPRA